MPDDLAHLADEVRLELRERARAESFKRIDERISCHDFVVAVRAMQAAFGRVSTRLVGADGAEVAGEDGRAGLPAAQPGGPVPEPAGRVGGLRAAPAGISPARVPKHPFGSSFGRRYRLAKLTYFALTALLIVGFGALWAYTFVSWSAGK